MPNGPDKKAGFRPGEAAPYGAAALVMVAVLSTFSGGQRGAATPPAGKTTPAPTARRDTVPDADGLAATQAQVARLLEESLALPRGAVADRFAGAVSRRWEIPHTKMKVVVATIPDPAESKLGFTADQHIDAIEAAAGVEQFILDRFWLPWRQEGDVEERIAIQARDGDPSAVRTWTAASTGHTQPGVLLFRRPGSLLLVLLVGESPTSGVAVPALSVALTIASQLGSPRRPGPVVSVAGPTFSGGAHSLATTAARRLKGDATLRLAIVSGTLTSPSAADELHRLERAFPGRFSFHDLDLPITATEPAACEFVGQRGATGDDTALLVEANTAFGAGAAQPVCAVRGAPLVVSYPLHVALARSGYEKVAQRDGADPLRNIEARTAIDLPLGLVRNGDIPPTFVPEHAAVVSERMLYQELDTLHARRYRFVGIFGTDPYDRIFLARLVRRRVPDAQLFMIGADVLYLHPSYTADLLGMWVTSTDPIDPALEPSPLERDGRPTHRMDAMPNFLAAGAGRAVLGLLDPHRATFADRVWLTAVGRESFWPLAQVTPRDAGAVRRFQGRRFGSAPAPERPVPNRAGSLWMPMLAAATLGAALVGLQVLARTGVDRRWPGAAYAVARFASLARVLRTEGWASPAVDPHLRRVIGPADWLDPLWATALLPIPLVLLVYWMFIAVGGLVPFVSASPDWVLVASMALAAPAAVGLLAGCLRSIAGASGGVPRRAGGRDHAGAGPGIALRPGRAHPVLVLTTLLLAIGVALDIAVPGSLVPPVNPYLFERAAALGDGLSPVIPSGLLALALLIVVVAGAHRGRLRSYLAGVRAIFPAGAYPTPLGAMAVAGQEVVQRIGRPASVADVLSRFLPPTALTAIVGLTLSSRFTHGLEGGTFDAVVFGAVLLVVWSVSYGWLRFLDVWRHLRHFLHATASTPLVEAFDELPMEMAHTFGLRLMQRPLDVTHLGLIERARAGLTRALGTVDPQLQSLAAAPLPWPTEPSLLAAAPPLFATHVGDDLATLAGAILQRGSHEVIDVAIAGRFLATEITRFISYVFAFLKNLALSSTTVIALLLFAVASYPIQPQQRLLTLALCGVIATAGGIVHTLVQIERNELLSRIADRTPHKVNFDREFLSLIATYAGIPALSLLVTQLPALGQPLAGMMGWLSR